MKKLRVGFIGAGGMADAHLKNWSAERFPEVEIAAFCDVVLERAQAKAAQYPSHGAAAFSSPQTMIAEAGLDACYILLPPFAHGDAERACIEAKVPFLVEKPIGKDLGLLRELRDEIKRSGLLTAVGYMNRYQPSVQRAKQAFAEDEPILAYGGWIGGPPTTDNAYMRDNLIGQWWVIKERSGGQMVEQVTHTVDLARYFLGDVEEVFAHATTAFNRKLPNLLPGYTMDDAMTTTLKFKSGALATILASSATPVGGGVTLDILGAQTAAKFSGWSHDVKISHHDDKSSDEEVAGVSDVFQMEDRAFFDAILTGDASKILTDYEDGFKTSLVTLGANQSAETGRPVSVTD